jgi:ketosteroid isomerase-like protein
MSDPRIGIVRQMFGQLDRGDPDAALEFISEDFFMEIPGSMSAEPDVYEGHEGARRYFAGFDGLIEDVRFELMEVTAHGAAVIARLRLIGRGAASGITVDRQGALVARIADGKITRLELYEEIEEARQAVDA